MRLLAIIFPPAAVLLCGKPISAMLNVILTLCFWIPGVIHAWGCVTDCKADSRAKRQTRAMLKAQRAGLATLLLTAAFASATPDPDSSSKTKSPAVITNTAGRAYQVREITRVEPDGITIAHASGIVKLFFWELPEDIQQQYNYDPTAAVEHNARFRQAQADADQRRHQVSEERQHRERLEAATLELHGRVKQVVDNGAIIGGVWSEEEYDHEIMRNTVSGAIYTEKRTRRVRYQDDIFIYGVPAHATDGVSWSGRVRRSGAPYTFLTVLGARRTIPAFIYAE